MKLLGIDPGLQRMGWGIIAVDGNRLTHLANGTIATDARIATAARLVQLYDGLMELIERHAPDEACVEETFVNKNPSSTLKLGLARGVALLAPARAGLPVSEYPPNLVKKSVVGAGHADKKQVQVMVRAILPGCEIVGADAADALAVAICHAHHAASQNRWRAAEAKMALGSDGP
jgi:crossover junction endodeoxyribonuclease RuvC